MGKLTKETIREGNIPPAQIAEGAGPGLPGWLVFVFVCVWGGAGAGRGGGGVYTNCPDFC